MSDVFLSYSRLDQTHVFRLASSLQQAGVTVWLDQSDIPVSVPWREEITQAIRGSVLFVAADTPHWRASASCSSELETATGLRKQIVYADPTAAFESTDKIRQALDVVPEREKSRARLLGDSYRWALAGRPDSMLPRGRSLRTLRHLTGYQSDAIAGQYLSRAARLQRHRRIRNVIATVLLGCLFLAWRVADGLGAAIDERMDTVIEQLAPLNDVTDASTANAYEGLESAIASVGDLKSASWVRTQSLSVALSPLLPATVTNPRGEEPAEAPSLLADSEFPMGGMTARYLGSGRGVLIDGEKQVTVDTVGIVTAIDWSADGALLAVADSAGVGLYSSSTGIGMARLRGLDGAVKSLNWTTTASVEATTSNGITATWDVPQSVPILDLDTTLKAASISADGSGAVVTVEGDLVLFSGDGSSSRVRLEGVDQASSLSITRWTQGWAVVGYVTDNGILFRVRDGQTPVRTDLGSQCFPMAIAPGQDDELLVGCLDFQMLRITGDDIQIIPLDIQPDSILRHADGSVTIGSILQEINRVDPQGQVSLNSPWNMTCAHGAEVLVGSPDGQRMVVAGAQARAGCIQIRTRNIVGGTDGINYLIPQDDALRRATSAAWSPDGKLLAIGFSTGHIWVFDTDLYAYRELKNPFGSSVLSLAFDPDGQGVLLVAADGHIARQPLDYATLSDAELVDAAQQIVDIGEAAGLVP